MQVRWQLFIYQIAAIRPDPRNSVVNPPLRANGPLENSLEPRYICRL